MRASAFYRVRNGKGRWYASIGPERKQVPIPPSVAHADTPKDRRAAERWAADHAAELEQAQAATVVPTVPTLAELAARFLEAGKGAPATRREYAGHLRLSILPALGTLCPAELTIPVLRAWVRELVAQGLARQTCANRLSTLSRVLSWARAEGLTDAPNHADAHEVREELPEQCRRRIEILAPTDVAALITTKHVPVVRRLRAFVAAWAGLEAGVVAGIRLGDVRLDAGHETLFVEQAVAQIGPEGYATAKGPKNEHRRRALPLHPSLAAALRWWIAEGRPLYLAEHATETDLLFPSRTGRPSRPKVAKLLRRDLHRTGVAVPEGLTFHRLRACFATWLRRAGVDEATRAALMGHAGTSTAERFYTGEIDERLRAAVNLLPAVMLPEAQRLQADRAAETNLVEVDGGRGSGVFVSVGGRNRGLHGYRDEPGGTPAIPGGSCVDPTREELRDRARAWRGSADAPAQGPGAQGQDAGVMLERVTERVTVSQDRSRLRDLNSRPTVYELVGVAEIGANPVVDPHRLCPDVREAHGITRDERIAACDQRVTACSGARPAGCPDEPCSKRAAELREDYGVKEAA